MVEVSCSCLVVIVLDVGLCSCFGYVFYGRLCFLVRVYYVVKLIRFCFFLM